MLKFLFSAVLFLSLIPSAFADTEFCVGFERGFITGFKQASGQMYDPFAPYCPFQPFKKFNDPESDFEHGYIIGFEQGLIKGSKK